MCFFSRNKDSEKFLSHEINQSDRFKNRNYAYHRIIKEFPEIFDSFNPSYYNDGKRFNGSIRGNEPFCALTVTLRDAYSDLFVESTSSHLNEYDSYHRLHFLVCQMIINSGIELKQNIEDKFKQQMEEKMAGKVD